MHLSSIASSVRFLALAPFALVTACAVSPASQEEVGESTSTASSSIVLGGGSVFTDPTSACSSTPAASVALPAAGQQSVSIGYYDGAQGCPYWVTEVTGVHDQYVKLQLADSTAGAWNTGWPSTAAYCAESSYSYDVFGYVPPRFAIGSGGTLQYFPGYWETIHTGYGHGYMRTNGLCFFPDLANGGFPAYYADVTKYTALRVATSWYELGANGGPTSDPMDVLVLVRNP
jgi:hypothetical protein